MIFKESVPSDEEVKYRKNWRKVFAWSPVNIWGSSAWVWLECVELKEEYHIGDNYFYQKYRYARKETR